MVANASASAPEEQDSFDTSGPIIFDRLPASIPSSGRGPRSVAATDLASSVGSVLGATKEAFLKSFTFYKPKDNKNDDDDLDDGSLGSAADGNDLLRDLDISNLMTFGKPTQHLGGWRKQQRLPITNVEGILLSCSRIRAGDHLKSINGRKVGPSMMKQELIVDRMQKAYDSDGYLELVTKNREDHVEDILVHATVLKPHAKLTYEESGMVVWFWGYLVIKSIDKESIFRNTVLKPNDNIISVNEILCQEMKPEQFAQVISTLPREITVTVLRRKERVTGKFG